jgi:hypothetical protein
MRCNLFHRGICIDLVRRKRYSSFDIALASGEDTGYSVEGSIPVRANEERGCVQLLFPFEEMVCLDPAC